MTAQEAIEAMREQVALSEGDPEAAHIKADRILVEFLRSIGVHDLCDLYKQVHKWYA